VACQTIFDDERRNVHLRGPSKKFPERNDNNSTGGAISINVLGTYVFFFINNSPGSIRVRLTAVLVNIFSCRSGYESINVRPSNVVSKLSCPRSECHKKRIRGRIAFKKQRRLFTRLRYAFGRMRGGRRQEWWSPFSRQGRRVRRRSAEGSPVEYDTPGVRRSIFRRISAEDSCEIPLSIRSARANQRTARATRQRVCVDSLETLRAANNYPLSLIICFLIVSIPGTF